MSRQQVDAQQLRGADAQPPPPTSSVAGVTQCTVAQTRRQLRVLLRVVLQVGGSVDLELAAVDANGQEVRSTTLHHAAC